MMIKMILKWSCSVKNYIKTYYYSVTYSMRNWRYPFYDLRYGIGNLFSYFKVIWNDRDWDSHFWLVLNEKKLGRMEDLIRNHGCHLYAERDADNIRKTRLAIKRIVEDDYHKNVYINHDKKWGESHFRFEPVDDGKFEGCSTLIIDRDNAITDEEKVLQDKEYERLILKPDYLKTQDLKYATMMINKYLFHWWD